MRGNNHGNYTRLYQTGCPEVREGLGTGRRGGYGRWKEILKPYASAYFISDLFDPEADFKDDARRLSNKDASFDTVVCFEALEHIDDTDAVVSEMYRVLKKDGYAIATIPFLYPLHGNPDDYSRLTPHGLEYRFKKAGFEIVRTGSIGSLMTVLEKFAKSKQKNYGRAGTPMIYWRMRAFFYLHQILKRLNRRYSYEDPHFFTHSYIITQKPYD